MRNQKKNEENKNELIDSLINGAKNNYLLMNKNENKLTPKKILADKKKEYLERNGIGISDVNLDENDKENNKQKMSEQE